MENNLTERLSEIAISLFQSQQVAKLFNSYGVNLEQLADLVVSLGKYPTDLSSREASFFPSKNKIIVDESFLEKSEDKVVGDVLYHELVHYARDLAGLEYNGENKNTFEDPEELAAIFEDLRLKEKEGVDLTVYLQQRYPSETSETLKSVLERYTTTKMPKKSEFNALSAPMMVALRLSSKYKETKDEMYLKLFLDNSVEFIKRAKFVFNQLPGNIYIQDKNAIRQLNEILDTYLTSAQVIQASSQITLFDMLVDRIYKLVASRPYINFKIGMLKEDIDEVAAFIKKVDSLKKVVYYHAIDSSLLDYTKVNGIQGPVTLTKDSEMAKYFATSVESETTKVNPIVFAVDAAKLNKDLLSEDPEMISDEDEYRVFTYNRSISFSDLETLEKTAKLYRGTPWAGGHSVVGWIMPSGKFVSLDSEGNDEHIDDILNYPEHYGMTRKDPEYLDIKKNYDRDAYWESLIKMFEKGWTRIAGVDTGTLLIHTLNRESLMKIEDFIFEHLKDLDSILVEFADGQTMTADVSAFEEVKWDAFSRARVAASLKIIAGSAYYHGTDGATVRKIAQEGYVIPRAETGKSFLSPMGGRSYFTNDLGYALIYAVGGAVVGHEETGMDFADDEEGGVLEVTPDESKSIPDEDQVGEWLIDGYRGELADDKLELYNKLSYLMSPIKDRIDRKSRFHHNDVAFWASIGKTFLKILLKSYPDGLSEFNKIFTQFSHEGQMKITKAWVFNKKKINPKLKEDGSNFFELATEIPVTHKELVTAGRKLYHATYKQLLKKIKEHGLKAPSFWAQDLYQAESFAEVPVDVEGNDKDIPDEWLDQIIIFEIDSSKLDKGNLEIDPNLSTDDEDVKTFVYRKDIPFSDLKMTKIAGLPPTSINPNSDSSPAYLYPQDLPTTKNPEQFSKSQNPDQDLAPADHPVQYNTPSLRSRSQDSSNLIEVLEALEKEAAEFPRSWFDARTAGVITSDGKMHYTTPDYDEHGDLLKKLKDEGVDTSNALQFTTAGGNEFIIYASMNDFSDAQWNSLEDFVFKNKQYKYVFYDRTVLVDDFIKSGESLKDYVQNLKVFASNSVESIIENAGCEFKGYQGSNKELVLFNDPKTNSTLAIPTELVSPENIAKKLNESRKKFGVTARIDPLLEAYPELSTNPVGESGTKFDYPRGITSLRPKSGESTGLATILDSLKEDELDKSAASDRIRVGGYSFKKELFEKFMELSLNAFRMYDKETVDWSIEEELSRLHNETALESIKYHTLPVDDKRIEMVKDTLDKEREKWYNMSKEIEKKNAQVLFYLGNCVSILEDEQACNAMGLSDATELAQLVENGHKITLGRFQNLVVLDADVEDSIKNNPSNYEFYYNEEKGIAWYSNITEDIEYFYGQ